MRTKIYFGNFLDRSVSSFFGTTTMQLLDALASPEVTTEQLLDAISAPDPKSNLVEHPDRYELSLLAPGMTKKDVELSLDEKGHLLVETTRVETEESDTGKVLRKGFVLKDFRESYEFPKDANFDEAEATLEDGVLTVTVKRLTPSKNTIAIR